MPILWFLPAAWKSSTCSGGVIGIHYLQIKTADSFPASPTSLFSQTWKLLLLCRTVCDPIKILAELMWSMKRNYKEYRYINHSQQSNYLIYCIKDILSLVFYNQSEQKGKKREMPLIKQAYQMPTRPKRIMKRDHWYITHISKIQTCTTHRTKAEPNICWGKK